MSFVATREAAVPKDRKPRTPRSGGGSAGRGGSQGWPQRRDGGGKPERRGSGSGRPGDDRPYSRQRREDRARDQVDRSEAQAKYDGPPIPEEITGKELARPVQAQLASLPDKLALRVARH